MTRNGIVSIACGLAGHQASDRTIRNGGRHFSSCKRCRADLVETGGRWATAPAGFRIVWKKVADRTLEPALPAEELFADTLLLDDPVPDEDVPAMELEEEVLKEPLPSFLQKRSASGREAGQPDERRRVERRASRKASSYSGVERRRSRDRRSGFGKKADEAEG